jgi:lysophospholipase L1-like esterase
LVATIALCISGLIAALLLEVGVLVLVGEQPKFPRHVVGAPFGLRINEPNTHYRHKSADVTVWFQINGQGMRADRDFPREKPPGMLRIVSLGDSYTIGYEVAAEDTFSSVLERELRKAGLPVEVLNAGVSGYSNAEECLYLERELSAYSPDLVLVSFYANDLVDNVRSGLFRLVDGALVAGARDYVPAGGLGNFLNTNPVFNLLSGYSNAFALVKERANLLLKARLVQENQANVLRAAERQGGEVTAAGEAGSAERDLAVAIFERIYAGARARGIPLVIQSIPSDTFVDGKRALVEAFPIGQFDVAREGLAFVSGKEFLDPYLGRERLYWTRSHFHWTPFAHRVSGEALARVVLERKLLVAPRTE